ncbi:MAG TPA: NAD-dependent epimerase/dehydratase family protein [Oscillatoriaceae cyanobacterium]
MPHALVTGGTGFIGQHLVDRLIAEDWRVTLLVRDPARVLPRHANRVETLVADLTQSLPPLAAADVLFHCAADMELGHSTGRMSRVTVDGTANLLVAAKQARVGRFVHVSSQAVYGFDRHYYDADESTPMRSSPFAYCETKRRAEVAVWNAHREGLPVAVLRPGFVYGPGDRRTLPPVVKMLRTGQLKAHIDWGEFDTGCLHVENCVEGIYLAGVRPEAIGRAYNLGDGRMLTIRELTDTLCAEIGVIAPNKNLPFPLALALGAIVETGWKALFLPGNPPMSAFLVSMLHRNSGFSIARARRELGYVPRRQWEESLPETVQWCEEVTP